MDTTTLNIVREKNAMIESRPTPDRRNLYRFAEKQVARDKRKLDQWKEAKQIICEQDPLFARAYYIFSIYSFSTLSRPPDMDKREGETLAPGELRCKKIRHLVDRLRYYREQERYYRERWSDACTALDYGDFRAMTPVPIDGVYRPFDTAIATYGDIYHPPEIPPQKCSRMGERTCEFPPPAPGSYITPKAKRSHSAIERARSQLPKKTDSTMRSTTANDVIHPPNSLTSCYHKTQNSLAMTRTKETEKPNDHVIVNSVMMSGIQRPLTPEHDDTDYRRQANERFKTTYRTGHVDPWKAVKNPQKKYYDVLPKYHPYGTVTKCLDWPGYNMYCSF